MVSPSPHRQVQRFQLQKKNFPFIIFGIASKISPSYKSRWIFHVYNSDFFDCSVHVLLRFSYTLRLDFTKQVARKNGVWFYGEALARHNSNKAVSSCLVRRDGGEGGEGSLLGFYAIEFFFCAASIYERLSCLCFSTFYTAVFTIASLFFGFFSLSIFLDGISFVLFLIVFTVQSFIPAISFVRFLVSALAGDGEGVAGGNYVMIMIWFGLCGVLFYLVCFRGRASSD